MIQDYKNSLLILAQIYKRLQKGENLLNESLDLDKVLKLSSPRSATFLLKGVFESKNL